MAQSSPISRNFTAQRSRIVCSSIWPAALSRHFSNPVRIRLTRVVRRVWEPAKKTPELISICYASMSCTTNITEERGLVGTCVSNLGPGSSIRTGYKLVALFTSRVRFDANLERYGTSPCHTSIRILKIGVGEFPAGLAWLVSRRSSPKHICICRRVIKVVPKSGAVVKHMTCLDLGSSGGEKVVKLASGPLEEIVLWICL